MGLPGRPPPCPPPRPGRERRLRWAAAGALLILLALTFRPVVEGDGVGYYSYLHSIVVDHDLRFDDEYGAARAARVAVWPAQVQTRARTGRLADYFPVGPAVLSLPVYTAALALRPSGEPEYGRLFTAAFTLASLLFGLLALALLHLLTRSAVAVFAVAACTPFTFYLLCDPSYSHTFSAFAVTLFVLTWWRGRERRGPAGWLALGLLAGLMALTRWQDAALAGIVLLDAPRARWRLALMAPGMLLALSPQLAADRMLFGGWLPQRPAGQGLAPWPGHYADVLFSSWRGLFVWSPVTLAATAGAVLVRDRALRAACLSAFLVETLINGALPDWQGGAAFGARRFLDLVPFWGLGLAALARRLGARVSLAAAAALALGNLLLAAAFTYVVRGGDPGYPGLLAAALAATKDVPRLFAQGGVARDLVLWPLLHRRPSVGAGLGLLAGEAACLALGLRVALSGRGRAAGPS